MMREFAYALQGVYGQCKVVKTKILCNIVQNVFDFQNFRFSNFRFPDFLIFRFWIFLQGRIFCFLEQCCKYRLRNPQTKQNPHNKCFLILFKMTFPNFLERIFGVVMGDFIYFFFGGKFFIFRFSIFRYSDFRDFQIFGFWIFVFFNSRFSDFQILIFELTFWKYEINIFRQSLLTRYTFQYMDILQNMLGATRNCSNTHLLLQSKHPPHRFALIYTNSHRFALIYNDLH